MIFCPVCGKLSEACKCLSGGLSDRERKNLRVLSEHLYLLDTEEIGHIIAIQKKERVGYSDVHLRHKLELLEQRTTYEQLNFFTLLND